MLRIQLEDFPFVIRGFHSDNGSEYINGQVAQMLGKLLVEFTKSHSRHTNDNALVERKNGAGGASIGAMPICRRSTPPSSTPSTAST